MHDKCFPECTNSPVSKNIPQVFPVPHAPRSYILMSQPWLVTGLDGKNQPKALNSMAPEQRRRSSRSNFRPLPQHNLQPSEVNSPGHLSLIVTCIQFTEIPPPPRFSRSHGCMHSGMPITAVPRQAAWLLTLSPKLVPKAFLVLSLNLHSPCGHRHRTDCSPATWGGHELLSVNSEGFTLL